MEQLLPIPAKTWVDVRTVLGLLPNTSGEILNTGNEVIRVSCASVEPPASDAGVPVYVSRSQKFLSGLGSWIYCPKDTSVIVTWIAGTGNNVVTLDSSHSLRNDAWGRIKTVRDKSLFHGLFTFNVPTSQWKELINDVEQSVVTYASSENGKFKLTSNGILNDKIRISSFRHPRYEPNRGHLYSATEWFDNPNAAAQATWGVFYKESGCGFRLKSGQLYGVVRTTIDGVTSDTEYGPFNLPAGADLSRGNLFDIQFQWRGVGDYFWYFNDELIFETTELGTRLELSMFNPALPISYEVINQGDNITMYSGCVDVTSEGGADNGKTYGSISIDNEVGQVAIPNGYNVPIIAAYAKPLLASGRINTRDTLALLATGYSDQRSLFRVWATRDKSAITLNDQSWQDFGDGHMEYLQYDNPDVANPIEFDTTKATLVFGGRADQDVSYSTSALFEGRTEIYQTPGDLFVFTMHRETGGACNVGGAYEFGEAI